MNTDLQAILFLVACVLLGIAAVIFYFASNRWAVAATMACSGWALVLLVWTVNAFKAT